jgi:dihydrodipicolinate synthase/N-acetylneuraminate lyase
MITGNTLTLAQLAATAAAIRLTHLAHRYMPRAGLSVPIVTALDRNGRVLQEDQRAVVRYAIQGGAGADIIFASGTTGEWNRLDNPRRQLVARIAVEECRKPARTGKELEVWVGITAHTLADTLENLAHAIEIGADGVVAAPLSIADVNDPVAFLTRDIGNIFDRMGRVLPVFLYDNADIAAAGRSPHLRTRDVKKMSQLSYVRGVKVTSTRSVLDHYMRAASHFGGKGEFGIYPGNAYLMFDLFMPPSGFAGHMRHYWNRYLVQNALPHGVVAGASNVMPREWQRAWQVCSVGDRSLMERYGRPLEDFRDACEFTRGGKPIRATIACLKTALREIGVCSSDAVAPGTPALEAAERREFLRRFKAIRRRAAATLEPEWLSEWQARRPAHTPVSVG